MLETILTCTLGAIAVFIITLKFTVKPSGVSINDQYKLSKNKIAKVNQPVHILASILIAALIAYIVTGKMFIALIVSPAGLIIARKRTEKKEKQRLQLLESQYTIVLNSLMSSLQAGASPYQALEETVSSLPSPSREIFIEIVRRARTGSNYEDAVQAVYEETGWNDLKNLQVALSLYSKTGCELVEVFSYLLQSTYEKKADRKYVDGVTASVRMTAKLLSVLPFFMVATTRLVAPDFISPLFETAGGIITLIVVVCMVYMGNRVVNMMIDKTMGNI